MALLRKPDFPGAIRVGKNWRILNDHDVVRQLMSPEQDAHGPSDSLSSNKER